MHIHLIRHCEATHNVQHLCSDNPQEKIPLTDRGIDQANELAARLRDTPIEIIYTSEYPRTQQTADLINAYHNVPIIVDKRISEWRTGGFNGKRTATFRRACSSQQWKAPGGESFDDIRQRVRAFLRDLQKREHTAALIVSHHEPLRALQEALSGTLPIVRFETGEIHTYVLPHQ